MRITSFTHIHRTGTPTGVGVHIIEMLRELASRDNVDLQMLISKKWLNEHGEILPEFGLRDLPFVTYPMSRRIAEGLWRTVRFPKVDSYVGQADWLYSPAEAVIATRKIPQVLTIHDMYLMEQDLPWSQTPDAKKAAAKWKKITRKMVQQAARIVTVSNFTKGRIVDLLDANPDQLHVIGNGVSDAYFQPNLDVELPVSQPYVLVVGGLTQRKNAQAILEVAKVLYELDKDIQIVVAGKCDANYLQQAKAMANVQLLGYVDQAILPAMMTKSVALLFLSRYEGFGMPAVEAMAAGTPVIASNYASLPEIVGKAGKIMDCDDPSMIASWLMILAQNPEKREEIIHAGRDWAKQFTWKRCVDRLLESLA